MYLVNPMPTQQKTAEPSASPTSENEITRPLCGCLIFCDSLGEHRYDSTLSSIESAEAGRSYAMGWAVRSDCSLVREGLIGATPERRFSLEPLPRVRKSPDGKGLRRPLPLCSRS